MNSEINDLPTRTDPAKEMEELEKEKVKYKLKIITIYINY